MLNLTLYAWVSQYLQIKNFELTVDQNNIANKVSATPGGKPYATTALTKTTSKNIGSKLFTRTNVRK